MNGRAPAQEGTARSWLPPFSRAGTVRAPSLAMAVSVSQLRRRAVLVWCCVAAPVDHAKRIADELIATRTATHAWLGVQASGDKNTHGA